MKIPIVAVVGPTASGKSELAVEICKKFNGEVVSADSMQIYKGMNIATAKPDEDEKCGIKHHMMDFICNSESFSVAEYQRLAQGCIADVFSRDKLPVVVGGTGLYIDTLLKNIKLADDSFDLELREKLMSRAKAEGTEKLLEELRGIDAEYAEKLHTNNVKRIVRALEIWYSSGVTMTQQLELSKRESPYSVCYIGLDAMDRQYLYDRINRRVDMMVESGLEQEARDYLALEKTSTSSQAIGYKELKPYFDGLISFESAIENLKQTTRRYAKRQLTWFRRNECINWIYIDQYECKNKIFERAFEITEDFLKGDNDEK